LVTAPRRTVVSDSLCFGVSPAQEHSAGADRNLVTSHTRDGLLGAVRAAAFTCYPDGREVLRTYRPGYFVITTDNRLELLHGMGEALGRPDFFVKLDGDGHPKATRGVQYGVHDHRLLDRARNYLERLVQRQVCENVDERSIVLIDGALTLRTWDTPESFVRHLDDLAEERDLSLIGVAKKTGLEVRGVDIRLLLEDDAGLPGRRKLTRALRDQQAERDRARGRAASGDERWLGDLYVARFAPGGDVYRVDVDPAPGWLSADALDALASSSRFRHGYPEPLLRAHEFSYLSPPLVLELQTHAVIEHELIIVHEPRLRAVFAPFGGRFK
jgi:NurA domain